MRVFLETERLVLRRFTADDVDHLFELHNDPEVMRFIDGGEPKPREEVEQRTLAGILRYYDEAPDGFGTWAAIDKATGEFVGWFELRPQDGDGFDNVELGYRLRTSAWGNGYAAEGSRALVHKGFTELGVRRIHAETMAVNTRSRRVMEKAGLAFVRVFHPHFDDPLPGTEQGEVEYALSIEDYDG